MIIVAIAGLSLLAAGRPQGADDIVGARVEAVSAERVDDALPAVPLGRWLKEVLGTDSLVWERSDCDLKPESPEPKGGHPVCATAHAKLRDAPRVAIKLHFLVATTRGQVIDPPQFQQQSLIGCTSSRGWSSGHIDSAVGTLQRLSGLVQRLRTSAECK